MQTFFQTNIIFHRFEYATDLLSKFLVAHPDHEIAQAVMVDCLDAENALMVS